MMLKRKRRRNRARRLILLMLLVMALVAASTFKPSALLRALSLQASKHVALIASEPSFPPKSAAHAPISADSLYSPFGIAVCLEDDSVLMKKNSTARIYPASLTKMMTVLLAIEKLESLQEEITLPGSIFNELYSANASMAGFQPGERVRAIDLLYGALLPSGAESCIALADHISGSERVFAEAMNQKAAELGMRDTHFANTTGLHDENHYTTVKDLAILLNYALKNDAFRQIFTTHRYKTNPTNKHPHGITFTSTLFEKLPDPTIPGGEIIGGKTGYTTEAGLCLASLAVVENEEYILVTAGAEGDHNSEPFNIKDALSIYGRIGRE